MNALPENAQHRYRVYGTALRCNQPMPELLERERGNGKDRVTFSILDAARQQDNLNWFHHWPSELSPSSSHCMIARESIGYRLRYPEIADFLIDPGSRSVTCIPHLGVSLDSVRHAFLDSVLPRFLCQLGRLIVHGSAVRSPAGRGMVFLGGSGWGKSTLASAFLAHGYQLLADDGLELKLSGGRLIGVAAYAGARLHNDSAAVTLPGHFPATGMAHYSSKKRLEIPSSDSTGTAEIKQIYFLNDPNETMVSGSISIADLNGRDAAIALIRRCFMLDVEDKTAMRRQFELANRVVGSRVGLYSLQFPREFGTLKEVIDRLECSVCASSLNTV